VAGLAVLRVVDPAPDNSDPGGRVALLLALRRCYRLQRRGQRLQVAPLRRRRHHKPPPPSSGKGGNLARRVSQIRNEMESGILPWCEPACGWGILPFLGTPLSGRKRFKMKQFLAAGGEIIRRASPKMEPRAPPKF
jgi:hypothetical protein